MASHGSTKTYLSPWRAIVISSLACLGLAACDGGGGPTVAVGGLCDDFPAVETVEGYPLYEVSEADLQDPSRRRILTCNIGMHYDAGYAVMGRQDFNPWDDDDESDSIRVEVASDVESISAGSIVLDTVNQVPLNPPTYTTPDVMHEAYILAARPTDVGEPFECSIISVSPEAVQEGIDRCLADLRQQNVRQDDSSRQPQPLRATSTTDSLAKSANALMAAASTDSIQQGGANVDSRIWTSLGRVKKSFDHYRKILWFDPARVGRGTIAFDLYRLNSADDSFDYYLVRGNWSLTPEPLNGQTSCSRMDGCGFFNNEHKVRFSLHRKHGNGPLEPGSIEKHAPENVVRKQTYNTKLGAGLKASEKGVDGSLSAEISTSYTYEAASISSDKVDDNEVGFRILHATDTGVYSIGSDLFRADPTTIGNMTSNVWAVYKFPISQQDERDNTRIVLHVNEFSGSFGSTSPAPVMPFLPIGTHLEEYRLRNSEGAHLPVYSFEFAMPHFSVKMEDAQGLWVTPTTDATRPLELRRGQTVTFMVDAGGASDTPGQHPISLGWQLLDLPDYFVASNTSGRQKSRVQITVSSAAKADPLSVAYIRFDTAPRAAAPGLQTGNIAIPVRIVN